MADHLRKNADGHLARNNAGELINADCCCGCADCDYTMLPGTITAPSPDTSACNFGGVIGLCWTTYFLLNPTITLTQDASLCSYTAMFSCTYLAVAFSGLVTVAWYPVTCQWRLRWLLDGPDDQVGPWCGDSDVQPTADDPQVEYFQTPCLGGPHDDCDPTASYTVT